MHLNHLFATAALAAVLAACGQPATPTTTATETVTATTPVDSNAITSEGWGALRVGMTRADVTAAVGATATPGAVGGPDPQACDLFHPANAPTGLLVMIQQDRLTSITLRNNADLKTDRGFGIGSTAAEIKAAYGASAMSEPHKYVAGAEYITVWTSGAPASAGAFVQDASARGIRYETDAQGRVTAVHAGGPSIQNVEGCS
ncbi:hypothetical protein [Terricaulis sp.]|uniref:hypothetical protein n=1 Tax=Terricaulis sp. TaxID=2768686 RepID=UPI003783F6B6